MIDSDLIQALDPVTRHLVKKALATLWASEIITKQIKRGNESLLSGDEDQPPKELAKAIRKWRQTSHQLTSLHQLGHEYNKELNND